MRKTILCLAAILLLALSQPTVMPLAGATGTIVARQVALATATASEEPLPANVEFHFQGQTPEHEALMRLGVLHAYRYLHTRDLETDLGPVAIWIYEDKALLVKALRENYPLNNPHYPTAQDGIRNVLNGYAGTHGPGLLVQWIGQRAVNPDAVLDDLFYYTAVMAGYIEVMVTNLAGMCMVPSEGQDTYWMIEGVWEYLVARIVQAHPEFLQAHGYPTSYYEAVRAGYRSEARRATIPLEQVERYIERQGWVISFLAAEYIAKRWGDRSFLGYYRAIGQGMRWRDAFKATYGIALSQFYDDFRAYRAKNWPVFENNISGVLVDAQGNWVNHIWVWACPTRYDYDCYPFESGGWGPPYNTGGFLWMCPGRILSSRSVPRPTRTPFLAITQRAAILGNLTFYKAACTKAHLQASARSLRSASRPHQSRSFLPPQISMASITLLWSSLMVSFRSGDSYNFSWATSHQRGSCLPARA